VFAQAGTGAREAPYVIWTTDIKTGLCYVFAQNSLNGFSRYGGACL